jgi:hypothetical protein
MVIPIFGLGWTLLRRRLFRIFDFTGVFSEGGQMCVRYRQFLTRCFSTILQDTFLSYLRFYFTTLDHKEIPSSFQKNVRSKKFLLSLLYNLVFLFTTLYNHNLEFSLLRSFEFMIRWGGNHRCWKIFLFVRKLGKIRTYHRTPPL